MSNDLAPYGDPIKFWTHKHDAVIALHMAGYGNPSIAAATEFTEGHVRRILHDPRAQKAIKSARTRMLGKFMFNIQERMVTLGTRAIENIAETIEEDTTIGTKAKVHQDNVSFELLSRVGYGRKDNASGNGKGRGGLNLTPEGQERFLKAVERSDYAREVNIVEAEIIDEQKSD